MYIILQSYLSICAAMSRVERQTCALLMILLLLCCLHIIIIFITLRPELFTTLTQTVLRSVFKVCALYVDTLCKLLLSLYWVYPAASYTRVFVKLICAIIKFQIQYIKKWRVRVNQSELEFIIIQKV